MFQELVALDGTKYLVNLEQVEYFSRPLDCDYVKLKISNYVVKIEISEWIRIKPLLLRAK